MIMDRQRLIRQLAVHLWKEQSHELKRQLLVKVLMFSLIWYQAQAPASNCAFMILNVPLEASGKLLNPQERTNPTPTPCGMLEDRQQ